MKKSKGEKSPVPRDDGAGKPEPVIGVLKELNEERPLSSLPFKKFYLTWKEIHVHKKSTFVSARTRVEALERIADPNCEFKIETETTRIIKSEIKTGRGYHVKE